MGGHAIITGGSSGIGLAFAKLLVSEGVSVSIIARDSEKLKQAETELKKLVVGHAEVLAISADVGCREECFESVDRACRILGSPTWAIACAGIVEPGLFIDQPLDQHESQIKTNYLGSLYFAHTVVPRMVRNKSGNLMFISSGAAFSGLYGYGSYGASKFAIRGLAESLFVELKNLGVHVSLVCPGDTDTPQLHRELKSRPKVTAIIAGGSRILSPQEVAKVAVAKAKSGKFLVTYGWHLVLLSIIHSLIGSQFRAYQVRVAGRTKNLIATI